jgi:hypothetical protein
MEKKMNKKLVIIYAMALAWLFPSTSVLGGNTPAACELYTKNEVETLLKYSVTEEISRKTVMPAGDSCHYFIKTRGETYSFKLRVSNSEEIKQEGIQSSAVDVMERQKRARMSNAQSAKKYRGISDLGTDAFWGGEDLWVLKDNTLLIISINAPVIGSFSNMDEMQLAREENHRELSIQVAKAVLAKLN